MKHWPRLRCAVQEGCIAYIDFAVAETLCEGLVDANEALAAFFCHLSFCTRQGHICVYKTASHLFPKPESIWFGGKNDGELPELRELCETLHSLQIRLPSSLLTVVENPLTAEINTPLCVYNNRYYFQKYWFFETAIHTALKNLSEDTPHKKIDKTTIEKLLDASFSLNKQQKTAVLNAAESCLSILSGGPGTGKSYTASVLIQTLSQFGEFKIIVAAPTGKAVNNLKSYLAAACPQIMAKTLHSLLEIGGSTSSNDDDVKKIDADIVVVDESSMIDVKLFSLLLNRIKPGARLVLIGDPNQLPPVEVGTIFKDLIQLARKEDTGCVTELTVCLRAENAELVTFADWVKQGDAESIYTHLANRSAKAVKPSSIIWQKNVIANQKLLVDEAVRNFKASHHSVELAPKDLLGIHDTFRILSPLKNGPLGVLELNKKIHEKRLALFRDHELFIAPIIITANDHRMNLFNGETGILLQDNIAYFPDPSSEGGFRKIPRLLLPPFEYAYCISVHKSQGSEFQNVLLVLPEGSENFGREVLYTAVTRSKHSLEIFTQDTILAKTLHQRSERLSRLSEPLLYLT